MVTKYLLMTHLNAILTYIFWSFKWTVSKFPYQNLVCIHHALSCSTLCFRIAEAVYEGKGEARMHLITKKTSCGPKGVTKGAGRRHKDM